MLEETAGDLLQPSASKCVQFLYKKNQLDEIISLTYFWNKTLHVSDSSSVHHQEFFTVHTTMVFGIQFCWQLASMIRIELLPSWSSSQAVSRPVWHIPLLCVQWKTPDYGQRNCPKHVEFYCKNKFEKLLHLVGFIIRIYHDARSPERQSVQLYAFLVLLQRIWKHSFYGLCPSYLISNKIKIIMLMGTTGPHPQVKK